MKKSERKKKRREAGNKKALAKATKDYKNKGKKKIYIEPREKNKIKFKKKRDDFKFKLHKKIATKNAGRLRRNQTKHEDIFRELLLKHHFKFNIQRAMYAKDACYIVDFYLYRKFNRDLVVELDGDSHNSAKAKAHDAKRTKFLEERKKLVVIRYKNEEVITRPEEIIEELKIKYKCTRYA